MANVNLVEVISEGNVNQGGGKSIGDYWDHSL